MNSINDLISLNNGMKVPCIGFGTYNEKGGDNYKMILEAIEVGYRYFDTASLYETERDLGKAIKDSGVNRSDLFLASKAWHDELDDIDAALERSLNRIGTDYLDVFLIHWPRHTEGDDYKAMDLKAYKCLEAAVKAGKIKSIGLSNFLPHHAKNILDNCEIKPVVDQLELHPGYTQQAAQDYLKTNQIIPQAWSPLGRGSLTGNTILSDLGEMHGKSPAQIALRFLLQEGIMPIVKSGNRDRMIQNMDVFDFEIDEENMSIIRNMPQSTWLGEHPDFNIPKRSSNLNQ